MKETKLTRKRRRQPRRLFGRWELAPTPPSKRKRTKKKPSANKDKQTGEPRGVALLMVLLLLLLATSITVDLQYDARIQLQLAANSRNSLQAEYLARSSLQFTHLLLAFNTQFQRMVKQAKTLAKGMLPPQIMMLLNRLDLWKVVPIECGMLKQLFGGAFGKAPPDDKAAPQGDIGKLYQFGDFVGNCKATLEDESSKINLNKFKNVNDAAKLRLLILNILAPKKYDPMFERRRPNGKYITRKDQVSALQDWVDLDNQVAGETGTSENSKYGYEELGYFTKNSYFDSSDEIRLVYGVDDLFMQHFGKLFTVFGRALSVNIAEADRNILDGIIRGYSVKKGYEIAIFETKEYQYFLDEMIKYRDYLGFNDQKTFINWAKNPVLVPQTLAPGAGTQIVTRQMLPSFTLRFPTSTFLKFKANTFKVTAMGHVGRVTRRITAVIYVHDIGRREVQYWKLH